MTDLPFLLFSLQLSGRVAHILLNVTCPVSRASIKLVMGIGSGGVGAAGCVGVRQVNK